MEQSHDHVFQDIDLPELDDSHESVGNPAQHLGELAGGLVEVDTQNLLWEPPENRTNYIGDIFSKRVLSLGLTEAESDILMEVVGEVLLSWAERSEARITIPLATRLGVVGQYMMQGKELREVAYDLRIEGYTANGIMVQTKLLMSKEKSNPSNNYLKVVEKLAEKRGITIDDILFPNGRPKDGQTDIPELADINLKKGADLSPAEVSAVIVRLLGGKPETFQQLVRFFKPENLDAADVRKGSEKELIIELREALRNHISSFNDLNLSPKDAMLVRRVFGGELSVMGSAINPKAVRDLTLFDGGRNYDRVEQISDALSAFAVQLSKKIRH